VTVSDITLVRLRLDLSAKWKRGINRAPVSRQLRDVPPELPGDDELPSILESLAEAQGVETGPFVRDRCMVLFLPR